MARLGITQDGAVTTGVERMSEEKKRAAAAAVVAAVAQVMSPAQLSQTADNLRGQAASASGFPGSIEISAMFRILSAEFRRAADRAFDARSPVRFRVL